MTSGMVDVPSKLKLRQWLSLGVSYYGPLDALTHEEFVALVQRHGGRYVRYSHHTPIGLLVLGEGGLPLTPAGEPVDFGQRRLISEHDFLILLDEPAADPPERSFTLETMAELFSLSPARLTSWVRAGLLRPHLAEDGSLCFDFRQTTIARTLVTLTEAGVTPAKLRDSLRKLSAWMPNLEEPLQQLQILERRGPLMVRLANGELAELNGQLRLDLSKACEKDDAGSIRLFGLDEASTTSINWHERAIDQELAGEREQAVESYRQALLAEGPDPQICFDLAHLLAELGRLEQAAARYEQVTELDPQRVEAWINLGVVLTELGDFCRAIEVLRKAVQLDPHHPMARYNLADLLDEQGHAAEASLHFRAYLHLDRTASAWANHARERTRLLEVVR